MDTERIHRALSDDGTQIAGRVRGQGPPLVLVNGGMGDGDSTHAALLPLLTERFACFTMSTRGRGLSADAPDHRPDRLVEDVRAFVDSVGEPVGVVAHSSTWALGAAAQTTAVAALGAYEPAVAALLSDDDAARLQASVQRMRDAVGEHRLTDAARAIGEFVTAPEERAMLGDYVDARARYTPVSLRDIQHAAKPVGPTPTDATILARIHAPVLLLHGARSRAWFTDSVHYLAEHLPDVEVRRVDGAAHLAPAVMPEAVATELIGFFDKALVRS